jgi:hypothetical protein
MLLARPGPTRAVAGLLFALSVLAFGGGSGSATGVVLAVVLGAVFAASMYRVMRRSRSN